MMMVMTVTSDSQTMRETAIISYYLAVSRELERDMMVDYDPHTVSVHLRLPRFSVDVMRGEWCEHGNRISGREGPKIFFLLVRLSISGESNGCHGWMRNRKTSSEAPSG